jgi:L-glyceraldehyde 3-phosphate reductase
MHGSSITVCPRNIGASSVTQLKDNIAALQSMSLTDDEPTEIDQHATDADINLWKRSSDQ